MRRRVAMVSSAAALAVLVGAASVLAQPAPKLPEDKPFRGNPGPEPPAPRLVLPAPSPAGVPIARPRPRPKPRPKPQPKPKPKPRRGDLFEPRGPNVISVGFGFAAGASSDTTGGGKLALSWGYRLSRHFWFDLQNNYHFGGRCESIGTDALGRATNYQCGPFQGNGIDLVAGIQIKFVSLKGWNVPVVPFTRLGIGVSFILADGPNDGAALFAKISGGARYHFTPWFALGGELVLSFGPAFRNHLTTRLSAAIDFLIGAEFHL